MWRSGGWPWSLDRESSRETNKGSPTNQRTNQRRILFWNHHLFEQTAQNIHNFLAGRSSDELLPIKVGVQHHLRSAAPMVFTVRLVDIGQIQNSSRVAAIHLEKEVMGEEGRARRCLLWDPVVMNCCGLPMKQREHPWEDPRR